MQRALTNILSVLKIPIGVFSSAADFLNAYRDDWSGCLLIDVLMPEMDGFGLLREMQLRAIKLPAMLMTGNADPSTMQRARELGAIGVLQKPFLTEELIDFVRKHLSGRSRGDNSKVAM